MENNKADRRRSSRLIYFIANNPVIYIYCAYGNASEIFILLNRGITYDNYLHDILLINNYNMYCILSLLAFYMLILLMLGLESKDTGILFLFLYFVIEYILLFATMFGIVAVPNNIVIIAKLAGLVFLFMGIILRLSKTRANISY